MEENMDIVNQTSSSKSNFVLVSLIIVFFSLLLVAIYLYFQIKAFETKPINSQNNNTSTSSTDLIISPTSIPPTIINEKFVDPNFRTEYIPSMKLIKSPFKQGQKHEFSNDEITYDIYIGTDWAIDNPLRNFDDKKVTINFLPAYNFSDDLSYIGFDFIGNKNKKYVTIKCSYDSKQPLLIDKCRNLINSFYLIDE